MITPDSSVLIAGADPQHPFSGVATSALADVKQGGVLVAHTLAETFAVLGTAVYGHAPERIVEYLRQFQPRPPIGIAPGDYPRAVEELARVGVSGGAAYDGLIAIAARNGGAQLVTLDRRASATYRRCEVDFRLLLPPA